MIVATSGHACKWLSLHDRPKGMAFGHHAVGKVQRFKLREILERELAGKE
jgi:hypothetical protein